ncbi:hypothetical protein PINS_up006142 [Pythium insidiosum]|nr:hypothetical protein PINS_up006142 [Pythium insidiosum]
MTHATSLSSSSSSSSLASWDPAYDLSHPLRSTDPSSNSSSSSASATFVCRFPSCGKTFQLKGNLKRHQNIHRGDKQFRCDVCGREFLRKADRDVHRRVHTGEKPYACRFPDCDRSFARRSDLLSHERTHSGKKPFACEFPGCAKRFARRFDLHKHQRMHDTGACSQDTRTTARASAKRRRCDTSAAAADTHADADADDAGRRHRAPPISPTDHLEGPAKQLHFELTCTQDHDHVPPDCFSALDGATIEDWDALLASCGVPVCCPEHRASGIQQHLVQRRKDESASMTSVSPPAGSTIVKLDVLEPAPFQPSPAAPVRQLKQEPSSSASPPQPPPPPPPSSTCPIVATAKLHDYAAHTSCGHLSIQHGDHRDFVVKNHLVCLDSVKSISGDCGGGDGVGGCSKPVVPLVPPVAVGFRTPIDASATATTAAAAATGLTVTSGMMRSHAHLAPSPSFPHSHSHSHAHDHQHHYQHPHHHHQQHQHQHQHQQGTRAAANVLRCRAPEDPHRPGCGHLPVRHRDHIDYVVEDNLFCQYAGLLADSDAQDEDIELLDDDFWEFYGAIGSMNTTTTTTTESAT